MSEVFHWRNTLQTGEYLGLGTLSRILNTTIVFYGWFPIEWVYNIAIIVQFRCAPCEVKKSIFRILIIILQWTYRDSVLSSDARLHVNGFPLTWPSLNRSFTIRHALPLRRHSRTQSSWQRQLNIIQYLARESHGTRARAPSTHVRRF